MEKKAELTTTQIVTLIILIASFIIILYFIFFLDLGEQNDKVKCQNSVAMRSKSSLVGDAVPLDCKTSYICITEDGTCEKMTSPETEKVKTKTDVYGVLAREMKDCWWMFGEGKLDYAGTVIVDTDLLCSICSQIAFDDSVKQKIFENENIDKQEFFKYLNQTKISDQDISYSNYLYGYEKAKDLEETLEGNNVIFGEIDLDEQQYIMMGITTEREGWVKWVTGAVLTVIAIKSWPIAAVGAVAVVAYSAVADADSPSPKEFVSIVIKGDSGNDFLAPTIVEARSEKFEALNCDDVKTLS